MRTIPRVFALTTFVAGVASAQGGSCPIIIIDGVVQSVPTDPGSPFGVTAFRCASCGFKRNAGALPELTFDAEPIVVQVATWSALREGDVIEAVNDQPITTRAGAQEFAYPPSGTSRIAVRRDGARMVVRASPRSECASLSQLRSDDVESIEVLKGPPATAQFGARAEGGVIRIRTKSGPSPASRREPESPMEGAYGFALACTPSCTRARTSDGTAYWKFEEPPTIAGIRAGSPGALAGLRIGDVVTDVDGKSILSEEGALRFQRADGKSTLRVIVKRDGRRAQFVLTAARN